MGYEFVGGKAATSNFIGLSVHFANENEKVGEGSTLDSVFLLFIISHLLLDLTFIEYAQGKFCFIKGHLSF